MGEVVELITRITKTVGIIAKRLASHEPVLTTLQRNADVLYEAKDAEGERRWKQSDKKMKTVYNASRGTDPRVSSLETMAALTGFPPWYMLLPVEPETLLEPDLQLADLVYTFITLTPAGRQHVMQAAELARRAR